VRYAERERERAREGERGREREREGEGAHTQRNGFPIQEGLGDCEYFSYPCTAFVYDE
jgi:hypothetical protein